MAGEEEDVQGRHGAEHSRKTWREPTWHGKRLNTLRWTVLSGVKLLPNVPTGTGGTKSSIMMNNGNGFGQKLINFCHKDDGKNW